MSEQTPWTKERIIELLETNEKAVVRAIKALYARQTADEKSVGTTKHTNGRGFNSVDAPFLSSIAQRLPQYGDRMTSRQMAKVRPMLRKYAGQLLEIAREAAQPAPAIAVSPIREIAQDQRAGWGMF